MYILDYSNLIKKLPVRMQSFETKKSWIKDENQVP
jgi:hypothetical protein